MSLSNYFYRIPINDFENRDDEVLFEAVYQHYYCVKAIFVSLQFCTKRNVKILLNFLGFS
jgi:hypothetical protein